MELKPIPIKYKGQPYAWRFVDHWWERGIWLLVPYAFRRWWVHYHNARWCAKNGHDDILWHIKEDDPKFLPKDEIIRCINCLTLLDSCTCSENGNKNENQ